MIKTLSFLMAWLVSASAAFAIDFDRYHTHEEINSYMSQLAAEHPDLVKYQFMGYSARGREIAYVTVAKGDPEALPALYMNGTHHGDEKSSTEGILGLIDYLVTNRND